MYPAASIQFVIKPPPALLFQEPVALVETQDPAVTISHGNGDALSSSSLDLSNSCDPHAHIATQSLSDTTANTHDRQLFTTAAQSLITSHIPMWDYPEPWLLFPSPTLSSAVASGPCSLTQSHNLSGSLGRVQSLWGLPPPQPFAPPSSPQTRGVRPFHPRLHCSQSQCPLLPQVVGGALYWLTLSLQSLQLQFVGGCSVPNKSLVHVAVRRKCCGLGLQLYEI